MTQRVLVLNVYGYKFVDQKTGEEVSGSKVTYVDGTEGSGDNRRGVEVVTLAGIDFDTAASFPQAPAVYDMSVIARPANKGVILKVTGGELVRPVDLKAALGAAAA